LNEPNGPTWRIGDSKVRHIGAQKILPKSLLAGRIIVEVSALSALRYRAVALLAAALRQTVWSAALPWLLLRPTAPIGADYYDMWWCS
jgi:hypothetical protein